LFLLASVSVLATPASAANDVFSVPRDEILAQVRRVGLMPMDFAAEWPRSAQAAQDFESLAIAQLARAQIQAVPSATYLEIETRLKQEKGGWFDPQTGRIVAARRNQIRTEALAEFISKNQLDAYLLLRADIVSARLSGSKATWHSHVDDARLPTGRNALLQGLMDGGEVVQGNLPAVSVAAILNDRSGKSLYGRYGALQLLTVLRQKQDYEFVPVAEDFVFADPLRNERAMKYALQKLVLSPKDIKAVESQERRLRNEARKQAKPGDGPRDDQGRLLAEVIVTEESPATPALPAPPPDAAARVAAGGQTIALAPVSMVTDREIASRAPVVEAALIKALMAVGYSVVPSSVYSEVYVRNDAAMGPYFDAVTGAEIPGTINALDSRVFADLRASHQIAAILHPQVVTVTVMQQSNGKATWDGVEVQNHKGTYALSFLGGTTSLGATVPAISLFGRIVGAENQELYLKRAGVQTLRQLGMKMVDVPDEELLTDLELLDKAAALLVEDLRPKAATRAQE
jgi:hypothetical protein